MKTRLKIEFNPRDLWIGAYFTAKDYRGIRTHHVYICVLPCLPIHVSWKRKIQKAVAPSKQLELNVHMDADTGRASINETIQQIEKELDSI